MITRRAFTPSALSKPPTSTLLVQSHFRCLHAQSTSSPTSTSTGPSPRIPRPTPFVPDAPTFLTLIGRNMSQHSAKIPSWEALFSLSSEQLRASGVEPARSRRYLLHWREKFRNGEFGIGGDLAHVSDGAGELKIIEVPAAEAKTARRATVTSSAGMRKIVVNVPAGEDGPVGAALEDAKPVGMVKIVRAGTIAGPQIEAVKGRPGIARIVAKEGLWEHKRGHKIDGGERRKAEVRSKRRAEERKTSRA